MRTLIAILVAGLALSACTRSAPRSTLVPVAPGERIAGSSITPGNCWGSDPYGVRVRIPC